MCFDRLIMLHTHITELQLGSLRSRLPFFAVIARDGQVTVSASISAIYTEVSGEPNKAQRDVAREQALIWSSVGLYRYGNYIT